MVLAFVTLGGCTSATPPFTPADSQATITVEQYDAVHGVCADVLRDNGFRIERNDYRFGVVTTRPKDASTLFESWVGDHSTREQARQATFNELRRVTEVYLHPVNQPQGAGEEAEEATQPVAYRLDVQVRIERLQKPTRYITHSVQGRGSAYYDVIPTTLGMQGLTGDYWETFSRDRQLEQRLLTQILEQAAK